MKGSIHKMSIYTENSLKRIQSRTSKKEMIVLPLSIIVQSRYIVHPCGSELEVLIVLSAAVSFDWQVVVGAPGDLLPGIVIVTKLALRVLNYYVLTPSFCVYTHSCTGSQSQGWKIILSADILIFTSPTKALQRRGGFCRGETYRSPNLCNLGLSVHTSHSITGNE